MTKREFQATEGLLHDVMRKQAGSLEKAVLEAVMNSVDAGADGIAVDLHEDRVVIEDDGEGMAREEVEQYFERFGEKDDDIQDKEFGKFRMGRGQIFNFGKNIWTSNENVMVVDLDNDQTGVTVDGERNELDTSGLSYHLLSTTEQYDGCRIEVFLYSLIGDVNEKKEDIKALCRYIPWLHDVDLTINGERVYEEPENHVETQNAHLGFSEANYSGVLRVYNKGAFVKKETGWPISIDCISKNGLDVNFARTEIIDGDTEWELIQGQLNGAIEQFLVNKEELTRKEKKWLLDRVTGNDHKLTELRTIPLVEDIKGAEYSVEQLSGRKVSFADPDNKLAQKASEEGGAVILDDAFESSWNRMTSESQVMEINEVVSEDMSYEMRQVKVSELSKRRRENYYKACWVLSKAGVRRDVRAGHSTTQDIWQDDDGTVFLDRGFLNTSKMEFATDAVIELFKEVSVKKDSRGGRDADFNSYHRFWRHAEDLGSIQRELINFSGDWERKAKDSLRYGGV